MKIFFAHSVYDYGTEKEMLWLNNIKECYPGHEIISANVINDEISDNDRDKGLKYVEEIYFFPIIDGSDMVIATSSWNAKRFTMGVVIEMKYAISKGKMVKIIENDKIRDIDIIDMKKCEDIVVYHIPGEDPVTMKDLIQSKGFIFGE